MGRESWLWLPARTLLLEPKAILLTTMLSVGLTGLTDKLLPNAFRKVQQQLYMGSERSPLNYRPRKFQHGIIRNIMTKEWRVLRRRSQPFLGGVLLVTIFLPVIMLMRKVELPPNVPSTASWIMMLTVMLSLFMTSSLTVYCVAYDDAATWLQSAPVRSRQLRMSKLLAALIPVWVVMSPAIAIVTFLGGSGLLTFFLLLLAPAAMAVLKLWSVSTLDLSVGIALAALQQDGILMYLEIFSALLWMFCSLTLASTYWAYGILALLLEFGIVKLAYWRSRQLGGSGIPY